MSKLDAIKKMQEQVRETATDMTQAVKGGGKARLLEEGPALAVITGLIEIGTQPQAFEGVAKKPAKELTLQFALLEEPYCNEDGTPYVVELWPFAESQNDKSRAFKMFKLLNWDRSATTWIDLIGKPIMVTIEHYKGGKDKKETKSRIKLDGFLPPLEARGPKRGQLYDIPAWDEDLLVAFLWDYPTLENWNALRDFHKEKCLDALNFAGSDLEALLLENGLPTTYDKKAKQEREFDEADGAPEDKAEDKPPFDGGVPSNMAMPTDEDDGTQ